MLIIKHRVNTIDQLTDTSLEFGIEVDVRSHSSKIVINHEALDGGVIFSSWLKKFNHKLLLVNIKEEGIEEEVIKILRKKNIRNYLFLDVTVPKIADLTKKKFYKNCIRISKYESPNSLSEYNKKLKWLWIDILDGFPISNSQYQKFTKGKYKMIFVSPDVISKNISSSIHFRKMLASCGMQPDAICTKFPQIWL